MPQGEAMRCVLHFEFAKFLPNLSFNPIFGDSNLEILSPDKL